MELGGVAVLVGVAVLALLRWMYWMVFQLTGDTRQVAFGWRVWGAFLLAVGILLSMAIPLQKFDDHAERVSFFDGAFLLYVGVAGYVGVCCLAGAVVYFLGGKSIPFKFCAVFCLLAWKAMDAFVFIQG